METGPVKAKNGCSVAAAMAAICAAVHNETAPQATASDFFTLFLGCEGGAYTPMGANP